MTTDEKEIEAKPWKTLIFGWLFDQGVSTVLLFAIAAGVWVGGSYAIKEGIPKHLEQIQTGYEKIEASFSRDLNRVIENQEKEREFHRALLRERLGEIGPQKNVAANK